MQSVFQTEVLLEYARILSKTPLEKSLLETLPLKIVRGLPRVYLKSSPSISYVKKDFADLSALKLICLEKFILPFYEKINPSKAKICIFTYMLSDGWGDLIAHKEVLKILQKRFPDISIESVVCIPKGFTIQDLKATVVSYHQDCPLEVFSSVAMNLLQTSDLIFSCPTHYPHMDALKKMCPKTKFLELGQYGFMESDDFHPKSGRSSMGLHFLEKGIITRVETKKGDFRLIENQTLLYTLFGTTIPATYAIENYQHSHQFYLAYLLSPIGGAVYLNALLQSQENNPKAIDICTPDIGWLIGYIKLQENKPFLLQNYAIAEIEIHYAGKIHRRHIAKTGKKVRIICPGALSDNDFRNVLHLSAEFVAVRGDQSFSECISQNRLFFYDGAPHARYFVKDLLAIAENKLIANKSALTLFRAMARASAYQIKDDGDFVEETYFQEKQPWEEIVKAVASALNSPDTLAGFKQLNYTLMTEYSCNKTICQMVVRELFSIQYPEKARFEKQEMDNFANGKQSLNETLVNIQSKMR